MADLPQRIEKAEKQLEDQGKVVQTAAEDAACKERAWLKATKGKAAKKASWEDAVKCRDKAVNKEELFEGRLKALNDKLPSAGEQAQSFENLARLSLLCLRVAPSRLRLTGSARRRQQIATVTFFWCISDEESWQLQNQEQNLTIRKIAFFLDLPHAPFQTP